MKLFSNLQSPPLQFIALIHMALSFSLVHAEERKISNEKSDEDSLKLMVVPFIFFAVAISLITSTLVYFLWTERQLLLEYLSGIQAEAKVIDYSVMEHIRCNEYLARIEFRYGEEIDGYGLLMRKDVQCSEHDFMVQKQSYTHQHSFKRPRPDANSDGLDVAATLFPGKRRLFEFPTVGMELEAGDNDDLPSSFSFDREIVDPPPRVYVRVTYLVGQPESAIGYDQALRSIVQAPTILLIVFLIACTCFCFFLGFQLIFSNASKGMIMEASLLTTLTSIALECGLWQLFAHEAIREMVYQDTIGCSSKRMDFHTEYESLDTLSSSRMSWKTLSNVSKRVSQNRLESMDSSFAL